MLERAPAHLCSSTQCNNLGLADGAPATYGLEALLHAFTRLAQTSFANEPNKSKTDEALLL